ncbi:hypothetical protein ACFL0Y_01150 [Patescibacteria group bacterium]
MLKSWDCLTYMTPERLKKPEYFTSFESPHLPECAWQEMLTRREALSPQVLTRILHDAKDFLTNEPGPNLHNRRLIVPPWINYWQDQIWSSPLETYRESKPGFVHSEKLMPFSDMGDYLEEMEFESFAGVLFVVGAEGHAGHVHCANHMADKRVKNWFIVPVWVFEQDSHMLRKERMAPFLPLEVRLSMWNYHRLKVITVAPEKKSGISDTDHYQELFDQLKARYCFASADDPNKDEKINRGETDINTVISMVKTERTSLRVSKLGPEVGSWRKVCRDLQRLKYLNYARLSILDPSYVLENYPELMVDGEVFKI